jgi:hypothetical protein
MSEKSGNKMRLLKLIARSTCSPALALLLVIDPISHASDHLDTPSAIANRDKQYRHSSMVRNESLEKR